MDDCTYPMLLKKLDDKFGLRIKGADYTRLDKDIAEFKKAVAGKLKGK